MVVEGPFASHLTALSGTFRGTFQLSSYLFFSFITWWPFQGQESSWICFVFKPFIAPKYNPWVICLLSTYCLPWGFPDGSVQLLSCVQLFVTPWTIALQASLSITNPQSLLKLMSIKSVMPSNHLILCCPLLLPSIFSSIRVFRTDLL